jgi:hypothetical protein
LHHCDNSAGASGGGVYLSSAAASNLNNIVYFNTAGTHTNCQFIIGRIGYSCILPPPGAVFDAGGNSTNDPLFIDAAAGNYQVQLDSPCVDAGTNLPWMAGATDLAGNPRMYDGRVDMGCYEFIPEPGVWGMLGLFTICKLQCAMWRRRREICLCFHAIRTA